jgi:hypothetical protein
MGDLLIAPFTKADDVLQCAMPQLDTSTYLGQVTWFTVVFLGFYLVMLTDVLPTLNMVVKVRAKKLDRTRNDARQFDSERTSANAAYAVSTAAAATSSIALLTGTQETQTKWTSDAIWGLSNTHSDLSDANGSYLDAIVLADASVGVLRTIMNGTTLTDTDLDAAALTGNRSYPELFAAGDARPSST